MYINKTANILDLNKFNDDAKALISKIEIVLKFGDDDLRFTLTEPLTAQEESDLDDLITNFVDTDPALKVPKIYSIVRDGIKSKHHTDINYKSVELTQSLIPIRTVTKGEVTQVDWYKSLDENNAPQDKVIRVEVVYNRDASGFAISRTTTRTWINIDESDNEENKITHKHYFVNPSDQIDEGVKRRSLLVKSIQFPVLQGMMEVLMPLGFDKGTVILKGRDFMDEYETEFNKFVDNSSSINDPADPNFGKKSIVVKIEEENKANYVQWLDSAPPVFGGGITIRQYLVNEFSI